MSRIHRQFRETQFNSLKSKLLNFHILHAAVIYRWRKPNVCAEMKILPSVHDSPVHTSRQTRDREVHKNSYSHWFRGFLQCFSSHQKPWKKEVTHTRHWLPSIGTSVTVAPRGATKVLRGALRLRVGLCLPSDIYIELAKNKVHLRWFQKSLNMCHTLCA